MLIAILFLGGVPSKAMADIRPPTLIGAVTLLRDHTGQLGLSDVRTPSYAAQFEAVADNEVNVGFVDYPIWVRLQIPSQDNATSILSLTPNFLDEIDIYTAPPRPGSDTADLTVYKRGDHRPLATDGLSGLDNAVPLTFTKGETTEVYIRILNRNSFTQLHMRLDSPENRAGFLLRLHLAYGAWFGGMMTLLVTQLAFFCFQRQRQHLLLACSTLSVTAIYVGNLGLGRVFLFPEGGPYNDVFLGFNAWINMSASVLAYSSLLNLREKSVAFHRLYLIVAVLGVVGVGFAFAGLNLVFNPFGYVLSMGMAFINAYLGLRQINEEGAASRLRAAAFLLICLGVVVLLLQRLGLNGFPNWTINTYGVSALAQTLLLTAAMAVRLRDANLQNQRMQADALQFAKTAELRAQQLVADKTVELRSARKAAEDALNAELQSQNQQVRFLEVLSHQYRIPLAAIRSRIDSMELSLPHDDQQNHHRIDRIKHSIARLVETLDFNLKRSRLQGPSFRPRLVPVNARQVVYAAYQRSLDLLGSSDIQLTIDENARGVSILADADMLELALLNLLENAVKYSPSSSAQLIHLSLSVRDTHVIISVRDEGIGIPKEDLPHILENGVRGANTSGMEGSGLGLFLVAKIAAAHSATVEVKSSEQRGTCIRLVVPLHTAQAEPAKGPMPMASVPNAS